jgi:hypothetical protein
LESRHLLIPKTGPLLPFLRVSLRSLPVPISIASGRFTPPAHRPVLSNRRGRGAAQWVLSVKKRSEIAYRIPEIENHPGTSDAERSFRTLSGLNVVNRICQRSRLRLSFAFALSCTALDLTVGRSHVIAYVNRSKSERHIERSPGAFQSGRSRDVFALHYAHCLSRLFCIGAGFPCLLIILSYLTAGAAEQRSGFVSKKKDQRSQIAYLKSNIIHDSQTLKGAAAR